MIISQARIDANRRNALRSTGPRTAEGKERSRANALTHGLCATVVVAEDAEAVQSRALDWFRALKPQTTFHSWLVDEVAVISLRIDRCERIERRLRDRHSLRAEVTWEDDRRLEAEEIGGMIGRAPARAVERLRRTPQGCEWLMTRWAMLAHSADLKGGWTADQARLAFDLLGTPPEFREGHPPGTGLDFDGRVVEPADDCATVARREIAALKARREVVAGLDEVDRSLAEADLLDDSHPELQKLRRYESALHRRLRWCVAQIQVPSPNRNPSPDLTPKWTIEDDRRRAAASAPAGPEAEAAPAVRSQGPPHPPFDLEPHECPGPGQEVDIPAILASRRERRLLKADARREARRRKVDRLRA